MTMQRLLGVLVVTALFSLGGCATVSELGYRQKVDGLVGTHSDQLMIDWGIPDRVEPAGDGGQTFSYHKIEVVFSTGEPIGRDGGTAVETYQLDDQKVQTTYYDVSWTVYGPATRGETWCDTRFTIGADHLVKSVTFDGPNCLAEEVKKKPAPAA